MGTLANNLKVEEFNENYRDDSRTMRTLANIQQHVSFFTFMPPSRARRVSEFDQEKGTSRQAVRHKPTQNRVLEEEVPMPKQSRKESLKTAIANRFANVPRNLGPGFGRKYVDSKRNKRSA